MEADTLESFTCGSTAAWGERVSCTSPEESYDAATERVTTVGGATVDHFEVGSGAGPRARALRGHLPLMPDGFALA